jgi:hypothetical protein
MVAIANLKIGILNILIMRDAYLPFFDQVLEVKDYLILNSLLGLSLKRIDSGQVRVIPCEVGLEFLDFFLHFVGPGIKLILILIESTVLQP